MEITEGCLSPFCLCQDDICGPFSLAGKYERRGASVHVCDLSQYVANMSDGASLLISAHMRDWGRGANRPGHTAADMQMSRKVGMVAEEQLTVTALLISRSQPGSCDGSRNGQDVSALRSSFS